MGAREGGIPQGVARSNFEAGERRYLDCYDVSVQSRFVELAGPALRLRVFEFGEGTPLVLLHSGGGFARSIRSVGRIQGDDR